MTDRMSTGTPSLAGPDLTDPMVLIEQARGGQVPDLGRGAKQPADDSWTGTGGPKRKFFDQSKERAYRARRRPLSPDLDYGPATPVVDEARQRRNELANAVRRLSQAEGAVKDAEALDRSEWIAATAEGKKYTPKHEEQARAEVDEADRAAAVSLHIAEQQEAELADTLRTNAWPIRDAHQAALDAIDAALAEAVETVAILTEQKIAKQQATAEFERDEVAPTVDPGDRLDLRPPGAGPLWQAPGGIPHDRPVRDVLAGGRRLPRAPNHELDVIRRWAATRTDPSFIRPEVIRSAGEVVPDESGNYIGDEATHLLGA